MGINSLTNSFSTKQTPQSEPIPGKDMAQNSAGGFVFRTSDWDVLPRFLIIGTEGGSYYASGRDLSQDNAQKILKLIEKDGLRVVRETAEISESGRAPKNTPAIFVLAMAAKLGNGSVRKAAFEAMPRVVRTGTHLFEFATAIQSFGGWGRMTRKAFASWYTEKEPTRLAHQLVKYQNRNGWSHADILRLAKPRGHERGGDMDRLLGWATGKWSPTEEDRGEPVIGAFEQAKSAKKSSEIVRLINDHGLPREAIPTVHLNSVAVWDALLDNGGRGMPITALIRNLPKMTSLGLIGEQSAATQRAVEMLQDTDRLINGRVHPLSVLTAMTVYGQGKGVRGSLTWNPEPSIMDALDSAFYASFKGVEPSGKRMLLGMDVSGSMSWSFVQGLGGVVNAAQASAAMAMISASVEKTSPVIMGFAQEFRPLNLSPRRRLDDNVGSMMGQVFGGTDCALPMLWAKENKVPVDTFVIYTDSETWYGDMHPVQALDSYKQAMGIDARLAVVAMTANDFTIADPSRSDNLDFVGFDIAAPNILTAFSRGDM